MNGMDNLWKAGNLCWRLPGSQKPLLPQQNLEARVGIGHIFPPLRLKYARFYWLFKQNRSYPFLSFLIRLVSVLVSVCNF
jgi:hypothetical protein